MADLLGFAYKMLIIVAIVALVVSMIAAGYAVVTALQGAGTGMNQRLLDGFQPGTGSAYSPLTLIKPFIASVFDFGAGGDLDPWGMMVALVVAIPVFLMSGLGVRWLVRIAK